MTASTLAARPGLRCERNLILTLYSGAALLFLAMSLLYNPKLLSYLDTTPPIKNVIDPIKQIQIDFLLIGLSVWGSVKVAGYLKPVQQWLNRPLVSNLMLSLLSLVTPPLLLELTLKPFASAEATTIFMRDDELGWRLRPNAQGSWGGVPVTINGKGLRGPELDYAKADGVFRILYLGDSVTIGYKLADYRQTYPYQLESTLEAETGQAIETINAGVDGYSSWQEAIYLTQEGIKYNPDLIVVGFVLNDVTEKFGLARYGGLEEGYQLGHTAFTTFDRWAAKSSILYFIRKLGMHIRYSVAAQQQAIIRQRLDVEMLAYQPDQPDVQKAWEITLANLDQIFDFAAEHRIPAVLVIFPFTFQFEDVATLSAPQVRLTRHARTKSIPVLDLLPPLADRLATEKLTPAAYFLDDDHLSPSGSEVAAQIIADFLEQRGFIR